MNFFTKSLLLAAFIPVVASAAVVPQPTDPPVTVEVKYETGTLTTQGTSSNWAKTWTSSDTKTGLTIDVGYNNINKSITSGPLQIASGSNKSCTLAFSFGDGWYISAYSFNATTTGNNTKTIAAQGKSYSVSPSSPAQVTVTLAKGQEADLTLSGENEAVTFNDFTVTLSPVASHDPVLTVDPAPAVVADALMAPTNIVGDHFNTFTTWYHILDGKNYLTGATLADAGTDAEDVFTDEYLFCAVKTDNGYALYNKAAGTAAPVSGVNLTATALTVNGADVTPRFAQKFCSVKVAEGKITRTDGTTNDNAWQGTWTSNAKPTVVFYGSANNMSTTLNPTSAATRGGNFKLETGNNNGANFTWNFGAADGNVVSDFTFLAEKERENASASTVTPRGGTAHSMSQYRSRITGSGYDDANLASFVLNAVNQNGIIISDVYVTVRRSQIPYNTRVGTKIFPNQGVERRIPAIARVFEGDKAGRLVAIFDYRHNGGDIGFYGNISLQISVSDDNGATWSEPDYLRNAKGEAVTTPPANLMRDVLPIAEAQKDPNKYWNYAFGDAALVADRESGKMLLMAVGGPTSLWNGRYDKPNQCVRWTSEDGGQTWSDAERVTYDILDLFNGEPVYGKIDSHFIGSGRIMQSRYIKVGDYYRVYAVLASQNNGSQPTTRNWVLYSDDFGKNWAVLGGTDVCPVAIGRGDECKAEELPDGSVVIAGRCRTGDRNFNIFRYTDATAAKGKWMDATLTDMGYGNINACDGEIMILPAVDNNNGEPVYLVLQSFPYGGGRNYVSIAYKALRTGEDMVNPTIFNKFEGRYRISSGASVYSTMAWQANNKLAFFWEEGSPISGTYLDLSLEEITDGRYSYKPDEGNKLATRMTQELLDYRAENDNFESRYVGHPIRSKELFEQKADEFAAKPSYKTYVAANKLEYEGNGLISVVNGGEYRLESGHGTTYSFSESWYLSSDGTNLTTTSDATADHSLFSVETVAASRADDATIGFKLINKQHSKYVSPVPATRSTKIAMTDNADAAGIFEIVSRESGHSVLSGVDAENAEYPSLHMDGSKNVVTWTKTANASRWLMELVNAPEGYELPEASEPTYDDYDFDYDKNAPADKGQSSISEVSTDPRAKFYFDLQGRIVTKPTRGIFIAPDGKKVIL